MDVKKEPTQGVLWHRLYTLLRTTHLYPCLADRRDLIASNSPKLKQNYILRYDPRTVNWSTRSFPFTDLPTLYIEGCKIGPYGKSWEETVHEVYAEISSHGGILYDTEVEIQKRASELTMVVHKVSKIRNWLIEDLKKILKPSDAVIEPLGLDHLTIKWFLPVKSEVT